MPAARFNDQEKIDIKNRYLADETLSCRDIARDYNVQDETIRTLLKRRGVKIRWHGRDHKYPLDEHYFDIIDTEEKAYFLGLMYADGNNAKPNYSITLGLQEGDIDILEKFRKALKTEKPFIFKKKAEEHWKNQWVFKVHSKNMHLSLIKLGCVPAKSLVLSFPTLEQVPDHLIRHFVRGYNDGDGCIYIGIDSRDNSLKLTASMIGNYMFLEPLRDIIFEKIGIKFAIRIHSRGPNKPTRKFESCGHKNSITFWGWLYEGATVYMNRKYNKYLEAKRLYNLCPTQQQLAA